MRAGTCDSWIGIGAIVHHSAALVDTHPGLNWCFAKPQLFSWGHGAPPGKNRRTGPYGCCRKIPRSRSHRGLPPEGPLHLERTRSRSHPRRPRTRRPRTCARRPRRHLGQQLHRVDPHAVRRRPRRRRTGQRQPRLPLARTALRSPEVAHPRPLPPRARRARQLSRHPRRIAQRRRPSPRTRRLARRHFLGCHARRRAAISRAIPPLPHDVANIQYTSGTTGSPKGVLLTHHNLVNNGMAISLALRATEQDRICAPVPLYHCFGSVIGSMVSVVTGAALILPSAQFDALATLEAVHQRARHRPVRRAHHVHRRTGPSRFRTLRSHQPAHRRHGGRALPHRSHAHRRRAHALPRDDHRLRPDRELRR